MFLALFKIYLIRLVVFMIFKLLINTLINSDSDNKLVIVLSTDKSM